MKSSQRQQYVIDRKFQLRHTFAVIGAVTFVTVLILGIITAAIVYNNERIRNIYEIEGSIMDFFSMQAETNSDKTYLTAFKTNRGNHDRNMETLKSIIVFNRTLLIVLTLIVVLQGIALYVMLIRRTHKISGPIYVMSQYARQILKGEKPVMRDIRQKDEMQEFYVLFRQVLVKLGAVDAPLKQNRKSTEK